jgi:drug/metabolite transporter (DMT)-like permease
MINLGILAAIASMLIGILSSLIQKKISLPIGYKASALITLIVAMIPIAIGIIIFGAAPLNQNEIILSLVSGFFLSAGFLLRYFSLNTEQVTEVAALGQIQPAIIVVFGLFALGEKLTEPATISILMIFLGSVLITLNKNTKINRKLIPSILGSASWGIYWIFIASAVNSSGDVLLPLLISRILGVAMLALFIAPSGNATLQHLRRYGSANGKSALYAMIILVLIAGLTNGIGDSMFSVTTTYNVLALGAAITALSPMLVALIAYFIFRDRLTNRQKFGFIIMFAGSFLLSIF